ncbi:class II aldolase/adducin family protein [Aestuariivirga sp.]|uniref:class II aldolase/adducin family protein n=1 Tax=Aestuariivirga sp. TaxID=2650926 RepID=UPI0025BB5C9C|nr:class II aldolase/adducin family protein [Aestuariivirga sp.]MCA3556168.1 class II aldolase [Aestuariivirga sp.]
MVELDRLRTLSARVGSDPLLVQAAGGNTSLKRGGVMWIKASGTWLKDAATRDIFVPLDHAAILAALAKDDPACESCTDFVRADLNGTGLRPSIETTVHALMPQRVVVHVHCVNTIAWAIRTDAEQRLAEKLRGFDWAFIPYARPGLPLAAAIRSRMRKGVNVLVLGNHGLAVAADSVEDAGALLDRVAAAVTRPVREAAKPDRAALEKLGTGASYRPAEMDETHALATDPLALKRARHKVFYPDHVVFLGAGVATGFDGNPPLVAIPGVGVLIRDDARPAVEPMGRCLADVMRRVEEGDPLLALTDDDIGRLVNWDAEKYRQTLKL